MTAKLKQTARLLVSEKIEKELMNMSPNLRREIKKIQSNQNHVEVIFYNSSSILCTSCSDNARGLRATLIIIDEFRQCSLDIIQGVFSPMKILRPTPYTMKKEYRHLGEEPREIYLSSAYWKNHWMYQKMKEAVVSMYKDGRQVLLAMDYALSVHAGVRSLQQMRDEKKSFDPITYEMEYLNLMAGGSENQYYTYDLVSQAQTIKKAWYPKKLEDYSDNKRTWFGDIKRQSGEKRIVAIDIAISASTKKTSNDLSIIKCIRALPMGEKYERQEVYTETMEGIDIDSQAIRIHELKNDFNADYIVFDARTYGINFVDSMAKVLYDEERDVEYPPLKCFNIDSLGDRCKNPNAIPIMWGFIGSAQSNHDMHVAMLGALSDKKYKMLISSVTCKEEYLSNKKEYKNATQEDKAKYELPYVLSDLTLNEMVNLSKEYIQGGKIKLVEPTNGLKDKYITSAMANLFIQELETNLTERRSSCDISQLLKYKSPIMKRNRLL